MLPFSSEVPLKTLIMILKAITSLAALAIPAALFGQAVAVYVYAPDEELAACCTCLVSPNSLHAFADSFGTGNLLSASPLSAAAALANIRQTNSMVIKLLATLPAGVGGAATSSLTCQNPATPGALASGMIAWGTHSHPTNTTQAAITETPFAPATLSPGELGKLTGECRALQTTASGTQCPGCIVGGLAAPSTVL